MRFGTKLIHNSSEADKQTGALGIPIYQTSTFLQEDIEKTQEYEYSRCGNPTRRAIEEVIAKLENGCKGYAFSSGMAAISSVLSIYSAGDHLIICQDVYGGTYRIADTFFRRFNFQLTFVDATDLDAVKKAVRKNTVAIFIETPSNPLLKITDISGIVGIAKNKGIHTIIDNTFMSPYLQRPLELGVDISIHSATKFIGGHSDVVAGLVAVKSEELGNRIYKVQNGFGAVLGPQDAWLLIRGLKTLKVRMDFQQESAQKIAEWLSGSPFVKEVFYPGLQSHEGRDIHFSQADGAGCVMSFMTEDSKSAIRFMKSIKLPAVAVSLGGVESIVSYPSKMSHSSIPEEQRKKLGIFDNLIRLSVGLEDTEDLINDFQSALI